MEEKNDNYQNAFDRCVEWLENNLFVRSVIQWFHKHFKWIMTSTIFVLFALSVIFLIKREKQAVTESIITKTFRAELKKIRTEMDQLQSDVKTIQKDHSKNLQSLESRLNVLFSLSQDFKIRYDKDFKSQYDKNSRYYSQIKVHREKFERIMAEIRLVRQDVHKFIGRYRSLEKQLDRLKQINQLGRIPLSQMNINGRDVTLLKSRIFWIRKHTLKLSRLKFGAADDRQSILAITNIRCRYSLNKKPQQECSDIQGILVIPLPSNQAKFTIWFPQITFNDSSETEYMGFAFFTVIIDTHPPKIQTKLQDKVLDIFVEEKEAIHQILLRLDGYKTFTISPKHHKGFRWISGVRHQLRIPLARLGEWKKMEIIATDLAGNEDQRILRKLPKPQIMQKSGIILNLPVVLKITYPITPSSHSQLHLEIERFQGGSYKHLKETAAGPLNLADGLYRAKAFLIESGERGPCSDPLIFRVDNVAPKGTIKLERKAKELHWEIKTNEEKISIKSSAKWENGLLALDVHGHKGSCPIPEKAKRIVIEVILRDQAGNETNIIKTWIAK